MAVPHSAPGSAERAAVSGSRWGRGGGLGRDHGSGGGVGVSLLTGLNARSRLYFRFTLSREGISYVCLLAGDRSSALAL